MEALADLLQDGGAPHAGRAAGITVHSPVDVLLASFWIEHDHALLHADRDFEAMERLCGLKVWRCSAP